jgi:hypothetical protein
LESTFVVKSWQKRMKKLQGLNLICGVQPLLKKLLDLSYFAHTG